jgi:protein subunit release factor A
MIDRKELAVSNYSAKRGVWDLRIPDGIRIVHKPSGLEVVCDKHCSQHQNLEEAMQELESSPRPWGCVVVQ